MIIIFYEYKVMNILNNVIRTKRVCKNLLLMATFYIVLLLVE